ncbi:thioredoxin-like protein [Entophlyctis helioformis]|nr:thioredoxin-like protein [Entophlyctis helioformis]
MRLSSSLPPALLLLLGLLVSLLGTATGALAQKAEPKKFLTLAEVNRQAEEADREIDFITPQQFDGFVKSGVRMVFYGAGYCKFCKRLSPKWLKLQKRIKADPVMQKADVAIAKLDCSDEEAFCTSHGADGYPTLFLYENGSRIEEYVGIQRVNDMYRYIAGKVRDIEQASSGHDEL